MKLEEIVETFLEKRLPKVCWTHEAHLKVGLWHVLNYSFDEAVSILRERIKALNEFHGTPNSDKEGYHETLTVFYLRLIFRFVQCLRNPEFTEQMAEDLISKYGERNLPLQYYTKDLLFSIEARKNFVEPDLQNLNIDSDV